MKKMSLILMAVFLFSGCQLFERSVEYRISGTHSANLITLNNDSGGTEQYSDVSLPKSYIYDYFHEDFLYVSAQTNGDPDSNTVQIYINGTKKEESSSTGSYVIATASRSYK